MYTHYGCVGTIPTRESTDSLIKCGRDRVNSPAMRTHQ